MTSTKTTNTTASREFFRCPGCGTATLKSAPEIRILTGHDINRKPIYKIDPARIYTTASGLCRVCDDRRLRQQVSVPAERSSDTDGVRGQAYEEATIEAMGLSPTCYFDQDGRSIPHADLDSFSVFYDVDGCELTHADLGNRASATKTAKGKALEAAADRILAEADVAEANRTMLLDLGKTDPVQAVMNKARLALNFALRAAKETHTPASARQVDALTKKLGHDANIIRSARLSLPEASRLLQRGPAWAQKKA